MKTKTVYVCEHCEKPILDPYAGVVLHGNLFEPTEEQKTIQGGAFRAFLPPCDEAVPPPFDAAKVEMFAYHKACLVSLLGGVPSGSLGVRPVVAPGGKPLPASDEGAEGSPSSASSPSGVPGLRDVGGPVQAGDQVRLLPGHPFYGEFSNRIFVVSRFRELEKDYALHLPDGTPMISFFTQMVKVTQGA